MPTGRTHDAVTMFFAAPTAYGAWALAGDPVGAAAAGASFVFAGLMFSGDLDLPSDQYRRWGPLRWIWKPYQLLVPHRSVLSHGLLAGPVVRLAYLGAVLLAGAALALRLQTGAWAFPQASVDHVVAAAAGLDAQAWGWLAYALAGLWLGGASHSLADWGWSALKRGLR